MTQSKSTKSTVKFQTALSKIADPWTLTVSKCGDYKICQEKEWVCGHKAGSNSDESKISNNNQKKKETVMNPIFQISQCLENFNFEKIAERK